MNLTQRVVLVLGGVAVALVTILTPRVLIVEGKVLPAAHLSEFASVIDVRTVGTLVVSVLAVTGLLWTALGSKRPG